MTLFAIIRPATAINNQALEAAIGKKYPGNFYKLARGQWLVAADTEVRDLSKNLGIESGAHFGSTLVFTVGPHYGLHNRKLWDWMREHK